MVLHDNDILQLTAFKYTTTHSISLRNLKTAFFSLLRINFVVWRISTPYPISGSHRLEPWSR